ncbi:MAG: alpha-amylase [Candidatus Firestonebacteria bacterium]|nr:alpha-amylase [Candidatus Firestonebacteria bacterium]
MSSPSALQPQIYEIPAWPWLNELSRKAGRPITLAEVPSGILDALARAWDAVWLMGVWERSPAAREQALRFPFLQQAYREVLPDFSPEDVAGSPYAVHAYRVDAHLGGDEGLKIFREQLRRRGCKLILDYVPNHVARDHAWTREAPEAFLRGSEEDVLAEPLAFFRADGNVLAHGRDPNFPPWTDTAQLNAFSIRARELTAQTLRDLTAVCDGVRCDMAMLMLNGLFAQTWGERAGSRPGREFWEEVIAETKRDRPEFLFLAEAYWDKEWDLQQLGFDFCYDKRLYERLLQSRAEPVRAHLQADMLYQRRLLRFLENHDEPRVGAVLDPAPLRAATVLLFTLPGARLIHDGQLQGARVKLPVQLGRRPDEAPAPELEAWYQTVLENSLRAQTDADSWALCPVRAGEGGPNPWIAYQWRLGTQPWLLVVNYSPYPAQGSVEISGFDFGEKVWDFCDILNHKTYTHAGADLKKNGLYVALPAWQYHAFKIVPAA